MKYTWEYEETDIWQHDLFDTIEDCILDAKENYLIEPETEIVVGEVVPWEPYVWAGDILDRLEEDVYGECGEVAEDWYAYHYRKHEKKLDELSDKLTEIVKQWLKDNGTYPDFIRLKILKLLRLSKLSKIIMGY